MESDMTRGLNSPLSPEEQEQEVAIQAIHNVIAVSPAAMTHADRPLHSVHCRLALTTTTRQLHWKREESKEATLVQLHGVRGEPFGSASPSVEMKMLIVNPQAQEFFREDELNQEYDVVFFRRPAKKE